MLWGVAVITAILTTVIGLRLVNYTQLESYRACVTPKITGYYTNILYLVMAKWCVALIAYVIAYLTAIQSLEWIVPVECAVADICFSIAEYSKKVKKQLALTSRCIRLIAAFFILNCGACLAICALGDLIFSVISWRYIFIPMSALLTLPLLWLSLAITSPIEYAVRRKYILQCKRELAKRQGLVKIGITGSMGKTSVKFILNTILSRSYKSYCTPSSYNTPMGVCRAVSEMPEDTQIFVCEMGARRKGDIAELCDIVRPTCGIITGITQQHLQTFKNLDNIKSTKYELIASLPVHGIAIFNGMGGAEELYERCALEYKYLVDGKKGVYAEDIITDGSGTQFTLHLDDKSYRCKCALIGNHNIINICIAACLCLAIGMEDKDIVAGIGDIQPIEHRLEVINNRGITIIDDSFNSNPEGAAYALDTLAQFSGRKIVAAQGLVELGSAEYEANYNLGKKMADIVDIAILIGPKRFAIKDGMIAHAFDESSIYMTDTLADAQKLFSEILTSGDTLLIENDLPDNY
ncbi:MAG: UDP-N-acetylmuramoyl-tripeptide--D-alanyl-D-alanine ligase [Clostridia bacterium]|nr:UDP-N-acetylmuramoyl-tripeptide--D-alanyl-D-alanine ligase [Clostridia bacterium]